MPMDVVASVDVVVVVVVVGSRGDAVDPLDRDTSQGIGEIGKRRASSNFQKSPNVNSSLKTSQSKV